MVTEQACVISICCILNLCEGSLAFFFEEQQNLAAQRVFQRSEYLVVVIGFGQDKPQMSLFMSCDKRVFVKKSWKADKECHEDFRVDLRLGHVLEDIVKPTGQKRAARGETRSRA